MKQKHHLFSVKLESLTADQCVVVKTLDQFLICTSISLVPPGPCLEEVARLCITLTDVGTEAGEIKMLFGLIYLGLC